MRNRQRLFAGFLSIGVGTFGIVVMVLHPENLRTPAWVAYAGMSTFVLAGAGLLLGEYGAKRAGDWLAFLTIAGLFLVTSWIAFGPGPRNCTAIVGVFGFGAPDLFCRGAFAIGDLLLLAIVLLALRRLLKAP